MLVQQRTEHVGHPMGLIIDYVGNAHRCCVPFHGLRFRVVGFIAARSCGGSLARLAQIDGHVNLVIGYAR